MGNSELHLYSGVPFDPRYEHSIFWESGNGEGKAKQDYFFGTLPGLVRADFRFIRKDQEINVNIPYDECVEQGYNYCCIINNAPYKKWFYFITGKRFVSPNVTALVVELDVIQTYQFDWNIPACMVEREHTRTDVVGENLLSEGLELGEFVINRYTDTTALDELAIMCLSSVTMTNPMGQPVNGVICNGIYSGLKMYARTANALGLTVLTAALSSLSTLGVADGVQAIWMYPKSLIKADWDNEGNEVMLEVTGTRSSTLALQDIVALNGYIPRNKKLLTYPYCYVYAHNNMGTAATYPFEQFGNRTPTFQLTGTSSPDSVARLIPTGFRGVTRDNESGITLGAYPSCAWTQDAYKIWMAQTAASQDVHMLGANLTVAAGAVQTAVGAVTLNASAAGAGASQMVSGFMQAQSLLASRADKQVQPPQAKGAQSGSCNVTNYCQNFRICTMSIKADQAKRLDQFFDMYGYQTNEVKVPELWTRNHWNFIKTVGCVVLGPIDADDRRKIGAIFDKGITLWHNPDTMYRYDLADENVAGLG